MRGAIEQFRTAIHNAGLHPPEVIAADGRLHRFASNGNRNDDAGWYVMHDDGIPAGAFGDWRTGTSETWRADIGRRLSSQEEAQHRARLAAMRHERDSEEAQRRAEARERGAALWQSAVPATDDHPYLLRKGVKAHGLRIHDGVLVVPMRIGTELHSLQFVAGDGSKRFLTGGRVSGCYFPIGKPDGVLCIAEGYATGASLFEATGYAVAVAFNAGNLLPVARALRDKFPKLRLIVCADDDAKTEGNPGLFKARDAAQATGGLLAVPDFGAQRPEGATDFNDLHRHAGPEAVRACIERAGPVELGTAATATLATSATSATNWPEPLSLDRAAAQSEPYPMDALPGTIGAAVREYQAYGQQPVPLVASSALAVVSLASQGLADVGRDERLTGPLSLNFLVIAQSGERKTAADKALGAILGEWERERGEALRDEITRNRAALEAWAAEQDGLKAAIKSSIRKKPDEADKLRQRLMDHALQKPAELIAPRLRYEDVNPQSLAFMLATGHPSAALWSDEGGMVTGSHGMGKDSLLGFMAGLNRLWDGGEIHHDRKQAQSVHLEGRRLTVSLMVQPIVLRELAQRGGGLTRGSGFLARYLVAAPLSTMGARLYQEAPRGMPHLSTFHQRIREMLDANLPLDKQGRLCPPLLRLSPGAFSIWRDYHDEIERELKPLGDYATVCDFAAKSAENAARIAGCLHVFEGAHGAIPHDTMHRAVTLARWYLREALRILDVLDEPQAWADARLLDGWLAEAGNSPIRDVLRLGPGPLRDKARRNAAVAVLTELGRARIERDGRRETLARNPVFSRSATATPATFATDADETAEGVAEVATIAVADDQNPEIERGEL
jgi:putative DNA primase/helicase